MSEESTGRVPEPELEPKPRRKGRRWAVAGGGLILVAALCAGAVRTPIFRARVVQVQGNVRVSDAKVLRLAGIDHSTNVMLFDRGAAVTALERDPWIAGATIVRRLPSTLDVRVDERSAVAAAPELNGYALIASDGTRLATVSRPKDVPVIVSSDAGRPTLGAGTRTRTTPVPPTQEQLDAAVRALGVMAGPVRATVIRVRVASDGTLELNLHGGTRVSYGEPIQTTQKARSLGAVLRWASTQNEHLGSIDLGAPMAPTASTATTSTSSGTQATATPVPTPTDTSGAPVR